jgi:predicted transcriptional regulator of viral defense system
MALPEVFTTNTLAATLGGDLKAASVYLGRWRAEGLISSLGPRVGVHFNLLRNPDAREELRMEALHHVFPGAVIAGVSAVHAAGWTTQIPSAIEVMIPPRRTTPEIHGATIATRPVAWFKEARRKPQRLGAIPTVDPAFALADLWHKGEWRPEADDLEWDLIPEKKLKDAFAHFDLEIPGSWKAELEDESGYGM